MPAANTSSLGERVREERLRRGISLRGLARDVGVSASMISQIETGKTRPSVSTLYAITTALGITMEEVFSPRASTTDGGSGRTARPVIERVAEPADEPVAEPADELPAAHGHPSTRLWTVDASTGAEPAGGAVVRAGQRQRLTLDTGVTWERLGEIAGQAVDFLLITYPPGGTSSSTGRLMRHPGAEFGFVLRGELVLTLGFSEIRLRAGDAVSFLSTTPHGYRNEGPEPAVGVWFVIERDVLLGETDR